VAYVSAAVLLGLGVARMDAVRQAALTPRSPAAPTVFAAGLFPVATPPGAAGEMRRAACTLTVRGSDSLAGAVDSVPTGLIRPAGVQNRAP
jgi:hypothetical protein